jgi:hypothetical protein
LPLEEKYHKNKKLIKDIAKISQSFINGIKGTALLSVKYTKKNEKNMEDIFEWKFNMANANIAELWVDKLNTYKK